MPEPGDPEEFMPAGLASLGIDFDEVELAVMRGAHDAYSPAIARLFQFDLSGVDPEPRADLSRPPEPS